MILTTPKITEDLVFPSLLKVQFRVLVPTHYSSSSLQTDINFFLSSSTVLITVAFQSLAYTNLLS